MVRGNDGLHQYVICIILFIYALDNTNVREICMAVTHKIENGQKIILKEKYKICIK